MKIKDGFIKHKVAGKYVAIATGAAADEFSGMIKLNGTASLVWDKLVAGCGLDEIVQAMVAEYEVTPEVAAADAQKLIDQLIEAGVVEE